MKVISKNMPVTLQDVPSPFVPTKLDRAEAAFISAAIDTHKKASRSKTKARRPARTK